MVEIEILLVIIAIIGGIAAHRLDQILKLMREREKRETQTRRVRELEPIKEESAPPPLRLTKADIEQAGAYRP